MLWETHILAAIVVGLYGVQQGVFVPDFWFIVFLAIGALFPDIDTPKSKLGRKVRPLSDILNWLAGHRGIIHSLSGFVIAIGIVGLISLAFAKRIFWPFFVGYGVHLVTDSFTKNGIAIFYPWWKKRFKGPIKTGSVSEKIFFGILLVIGLMLFY